MKALIYQAKERGFTLVEILTVIAVLGILAGIVIVSTLESGQQSRDAKRQADIRTLQSAIELYKSKYGRYPAGCNGPGVWSGQQGSNYACSGGNTQYIVDLAPEFIPALPIDKKLPDTNAGYMYRTNTNGTVYKIRAHRVVEAETVTHLHTLKACDIRNPSSGALNREVIGWCMRVSHFGNNLAPECNDFSVAGTFNKSYGAWGGFEPKRNISDTCGGQINCNPDVVQDTTTVICR